MNKLIADIIREHNGPYSDNGVSVIRVSGIDNKQFLQGQLTNDIDSLGNASSSDLKMMEDCSYIAVGHRSSRPWITKFDELGDEIWSRTFEEIPIPQGNYGSGLIYATAVDKTNDGGYVISCATTDNHPSYNSTGRIIKVDSLGATEFIIKFPGNRAHH